MRTDTHSLSYGLHKTHTNKDVYDCTALNTPKPKSEIAQTAERVWVAHKPNTDRERERESLLNFYYRYKTISTGWDERTFLRDTLAVAAVTRCF